MKKISLFYIHHNDKEGYNVGAKQMCTFVVFNFSNANIVY